MVFRSLYSATMCTDSHLGVRSARTRLSCLGGGQQDERRSTRNFRLVVPTEVAAARLRSLFPSNPRPDLSLNLLGDLRGTSAPISLNLGVDPVTRLDRGAIEFASAALPLPASDGGPQGLIRLDHHRSEAHRLSWRYIYDSRVNSPSDAGVTFP